MPPQPSAPSPAPPPLSDAELALQRKLKAIVIGLGVLIALALVAIMAGMTYRLSRVGQQSPAGASSQSNAPRDVPAATNRWQSETKLPLPRGHVLKSTALSGSHLVVTHEGPDGTGILILDLASGHVISRISLEPTR